MSSLRWCIYCEGDDDTGCEVDCPDSSNEQTEESTADERRDDER
jgi:hypothetical protein